MASKEAGLAPLAAAVPSRVLSGAWIPERLGLPPSALSGLSAGLLEVLAVQPLDAVKTRFQLQAGSNPSVLRGLVELVREGGILRLYRGMMPEVVSTVPGRTAMYNSYGLVLRHPASEGLCRSPLGGTRELVAGLCSGVPEALVMTPLQLVKVRLQAKEYVGRYRNGWDCVLTILRQEGPRAFLIGLESTVYRNCIWNAAYFWSQSRLRKHSAPVVMPEALRTATAAFLGGAFATCFNAPFDVAKSRRQRQLLDRAAVESPQCRGTWAILARVVREEGVRALYKGFAPKVLRMALGGAVGLVTFEAAQCFLGVEG
mmetsp:Transcript_69254/g.150727  ORF Transcript_69254/g.150727 Transcript_69254/m.150727 type:complete len:315 (+) Transcript_69254:71-1015(+)